MPGFSFSMLPLKLMQASCPNRIPKDLGEELGWGADGQVFTVKDNPNIVHKLSAQFDQSPLGINGSLALLNRWILTERVLVNLQIRLPTTYAKVYGYRFQGFYVRKEDGAPHILYYYTMERLQKTTDDERKVFHSILSHEDQNIVKNYSPDKLKEMLHGMKLGLDFNMAQVISFCDNFQKVPINHNDLHPRNIMKDQKGNFKLIDFDRATMET